jgi:two-component system sensor histidine kinase BaeS
VEKSQFDRLYVKLFAAIAGAIGVLTLAAWLVFSWSFERGFVQYLQRADEVRLERLVDRLEDVYVREGGWSALSQDRDRWSEMSRDALGLARSSSGRSTSAVVDRKANPLRDTPLTIDRRLMLFDAERMQLLGPSQVSGSAVLKTIVVNGTTVGHLGYVPRPEVIESIERVYLERQHLAFGAIAAGMLLAAIILGAGIAHWLTRRIRVLARGTSALMQGDYEVRLETHGHDELSQLARDFNALAETLSATREARQQWIADIAHELRTPLSVLRAEIESLQDGVRPLDQTSITSLASEAARLARLVEDLHTLSMSDLGALSYHKEAVPVSEVITDVLDAQRRAIEERGLELSTDFDEGALVLADETRLAQVFANLLQNTLRYTDAPGTIRIAVRRSRDRVIAEWEDSAPGVADEELSRLTERLYRVEASRSRAGGGSGLGLAIAKAIVEGHGGTLDARRSALGGLLIAITLPAYKGTGHG